MQWEYKDLSIPLEVPIGGLGPFSGEIVREVERLVRAALDQAAAEGWEAAHPTSLERLFEAKPTRIIYEPEGPCRWASATIRLKRLVPA